MRDDAGEEGVRGRGILVRVRVELVARRLGEGRDVVEGDLAQRRGDGIPDAQLGERFAEGMRTLEVARRSWEPLPGDRGEHRRRALHRGALHVVEHRADAAQLLPAARAAGAAVHEVRNRRAVPGARPGVVAVEDERAAVVGGDALDDGAGDLRVVRRDGRDERAAAEGRELDRLLDRVVSDDRGDRAEGLDRMGGLRQGIREVQEHGLQEGAFGCETGRAVGEPHLGLVERAHDDLAARRHELADAGEHLGLLLAAHERPHRHALGTRVAHDDALGDACGHRRDEAVDLPGGHDRPTDARALLPGLDGQLGHERLDVGVELGAPGDGIRAEDRGVERVGLPREAHSPVHDVRMRAQRVRGARRAGESQEVPVVEVVEQVARGTRDELQRPLRQDARLDHGAHGRLGEVHRRRRGLDDRGHPGEERRRELLEHAPDREVEGVDLHRDARQARVDVLAEEGAVLGEHLGRPVDDEVRVRQLAAALRSEGEEHPDAAVDVDHRIAARRTGLRGHRVELLAPAVEILGELLELEGALVEGERSEGGLAYGARVVDRTRDVGALDAHLGDHVARARVAHRDARGIRRPPGALQIARDVAHGRTHSVPSFGQS